MSIVSVCITTYNRKDLLFKAVKSVCQQSYKNIEIIIVDDCSNDGTDVIVKDKLLELDHRINYIRHKTNRGLASARNTALRNAKGKFYTFIDDDDEWNTHFIEEFIKTASQYSSDWCFVCGYKYINNKGKVYDVIPHYEGKLKDIIYQGYSPPVASQFYYLDTVKSVGGFNESVKSGIDHDLWIKLASRDVSVKTLPQALSIPNFNILMDRMTAKIEVRENFILDSLLIWKSQLVSTFGMKFYKHFCNEYKFYLIYNSIKYYAINSRYLHAFRVFNQSKYKKRIIFSIIERGIRKYSNNTVREVELQPIFKPF
jgi:glycosyltransferase involved in cell wall biosynthesis|tara:strand:- start:1603 stop:2541 length:939 start_codon:yes stop_codon:yes gene_type:complete